MVAATMFGPEIARLRSIPMALQRSPHGSFSEGLVANETQYFADRFDPAPSRAHLIERAG
jgi:hypothetical protein